MSSTRGAASARTALPRFVRLLSAFHSAKQDQSTNRMLLGAVFSRDHFPKTLAATCILSFGVGFCGMNRWQRNRQLRWEQKQEELELEQFYYNRKVANQDQGLSAAPIPTTAESV
mmetsp:Transcript_7837/g.19466  ORF Transcript_7837/g.19466 Transcript_7837/m.19466 type:complete len:115 (-) Transcript_7837:2422-2766(-)